MRTKLFVRELHGAVIGELSDFTQFDMIKRRRDVASWSVTIPNHSLAQDITQPGAGIVVERDGKVILSGPMTEVQRDWAEDKDGFVVTGFSDAIVLWDHLVFPHPQDFTVRAYDVFTGPAETAMRYYVAADVIGQPLTGFAPISLAPNDNARGASVTGRGRFQTVGDLLQSLAISGGEMDFDVVNRVFDVSMPRDRKADAVFSIESGNLSSFSYSIKAPKATSMLVAGGGAGTERTFVSGFTPGAAQRWGRQIQVFVDRRDTLDVSEMLQTLNEELTKQQEENTVSLRPIDVPGREYGTDYEVNDLVTVEDIEARIAEVRITLDENGETILPSVSSTSTIAAQSILRAFDEIRTLKREVRDLQRIP